MKRYHEAANLPEIVAARGSLQHRVASDDPGGRHFRGGRVYATAARRPSPPFISARARRPDGGILAVAAAAVVDRPCACRRRVREPAYRPSAGRTRQLKYARQNRRRAASSS